MREENTGLKRVFFIQRGNFNQVPISLNVPSLDCGRKPENPEETHADTGRTCKLHTERPGSPQPGIEPRPSCCEVEVLPTAPPCRPPRHRAAHTVNGIKGVLTPQTSTTALTCVLHCFHCEPSWAERPFLLRSRAVSPATATMTRSKTFQAYLPNCHRTYSCIHCRAHLANHDELISKSFQGSQGRAYLFNSVVNVGCGPAEERVLLTGLHAVADIYCENCKTTLGWKYEHAFESSQKYKEGKFIIELAHMIKDNGWD
ncbi:protein yippee-like 1 [Astyanax mexicanus]|uniref:Protein yippee-like 1 n=18 Tax=Osteoglossocephalai TaxID=1489341 RepID=A0A8T2KYH3_ASTMX|nr:protein yippee-like 1 [Astyanax mexicanus]